MTAEPSALQGEGSSKMSAQRIISLRSLSFPAGESSTFPGGQNPAGFIWTNWFVAPWGWVRQCLVRSIFYHYLQNRLHF